MSEVRSRMKSIAAEVEWIPYDPENSEDIEENISADHDGNFSPLSNVEGPSVKPGAILFVKEFNMRMPGDDPRGAPEVNIFLDNPKSSVIILSLGPIDDEVLLKSMTEGQLASLVQEKFQAALRELSDGPGEKL